MCGLVMIAGDITYKLDKVFKTLLILDSLRGTDSTGIAAVMRNGNADIAKQVGNPFELMDMPKFDRLICRFNKVLLGHNRYATSGSVDRKNAHPFEFDGLIGAHNGTLTNKYRLDDSADFKVDSENLYHHINKNGLEHAINIIKGAWSLIWWDKDKCTINLLRNKERPMFIAYTKDGSAIIAASEAWMIEVACSREGVAITDVYSTKVDTHYSFPIDNQGKLGAAVMNIVEGAVEAPVVNNVQNLPWVPPKQQQQQKADESPKSRGTPQNVEAATVSGGMYSGSQVTLEVIKECIDTNGARYAECYDPQMPTTPIRLYLKKEDNFLVLDGKEITGTIGRYHMKAGANRGYYKVDYNTFRLVKPVRKEEETFLNPKGVPLSRDDWEQNHGECAWCSAPVFAGDVHKFTKDGETLCENCCADTEVMCLVH